MPTELFPDYELAGDHMKLTTGEDGSATVSWSDKPSGRVCGTCTLCCTLVPVPSLDKPAGKRCQFARFSKGCTIYARRPGSCRTWACLWLIDASTAGLPRPDRAHYVIDMTPDFIRASGADGVMHEHPVIQIWVDPAYPDAHRAPELRAWLERQAERWGYAAIIRRDNSSAIILAAPCLSNDRQWHAFTPTKWNDVGHTDYQVAAVAGSNLFGVR
jgi:hypothetical protein